LSPKPKPQNTAPRRGVRNVFQISWRGWHEIIMRSKQDSKDDNVPIVAAGIAYYALLSIFPALTALVSVYGLISNPEEVHSQLQHLQQLMPEEAFEIINQQLVGLVRRSGGALGFNFLISLLFTFWSASRGIKAIIHAFNIAYNEPEKRGIISFSLTGMILTIGLLLFLALSMLLIVALPAVVQALRLDEQMAPWVMMLRWPILLLTVVFGLAIMYRFAPCRAYAKLKWVLPGASIATLFWLIASYLFSFYVQNFGSYNQVYGSLSAVIILLLWFFLTAYVVLLGAELNSEIETYCRPDLHVSD